MKVGWIKRSLREVTTKIGSGATPLGGEKAYKKSGISLIRSLNVHDAGFRTKDLAFIDDVQAEQLDNVVVEEGDVLLNITGASIARCCVVPKKVLPARVNQHVSILRPTKTHILPELLHYMLISHDYKDRLLATGAAGATRQALTKAQLQAFVIGYPESLPEQRRIVGILDEAFDGIATAKANAEKNLQNARALFESHLNAVFTNCGEGWVEKTLGDVCDLLNGYAFKSEDAVPKSETQLVRIGNLYGNRLDLNRKPVFYPDIFAVDYPRYLLNEGDLIISLTGTKGKEDYGYTVRVAKCCHKLLMNQRIAKFDNINDKVVNRGYLYYFLRSRAFLDCLFSTANGTRQGNLSSVTIKTISIPLCDVTKQKGIASVLDEVLHNSQRLETIYQQKLVALDELKKSLLHQAFTGQL